MLSRLLELPGMVLHDQRAGVYVLKWDVPRGFPRRLAISYGKQKPNPKLLVSNPMILGDRWNQQSGYVVSGFYQIVDRPQTFRYSIDLQSDGPLILEVWNSTSNELLVRRNVVGTENQVQHFILRGRVPRIHGIDVWNGLWPFVSQVEKPTYPGDALELRVFRPSGVRCLISAVEFKTQFRAN